MDSVTQFTLGAAVGEACIGRKAGHKAWIWGALLATLPDLDILAYPLMDIVAFTKFHRGPSHSITLLLPLSLLLAFVLPKIHPQTPITRYRWWLFASFVLITHTLLDCFTTWGTQLFWPFEGAIAWNNIFVIDPFYTLPLLIFLVLAIWQHKKEEKRKKLIRTGLIISTAYLALTLANKAYMNTSFQEELEKEARIQDFQTSPSPLNNFLWSTMALTEKGNYLVGYRTLFAIERDIRFRKIKGQHRLLKELKAYENVQGLIDISKGFYAVEKAEGENLTFYDLRFGEFYFWEPERAEPVFTYRIAPQKKGQPKIERVEEAMDLKDGDFAAFLASIWKGVPPRS